MKVVFDGPAGQVNREIASHLRAESPDFDEAGEPIEISDELQPGAVYDLPADLAKSAVASSEFFRFASDYGSLSKKELTSIADGYEIDGRSTMTKDELVAAIREHEGRS